MEVSLPPPTPASPVLQPIHPAYLPPPPRSNQTMPQPQPQPQPRHRPLPKPQGKPGFRKIPYRAPPPKSYLERRDLIVPDEDMVYSVKGEGMAWRKGRVADEKLDAQMRWDLLGDEVVRKILYYYVEDLESHEQDFYKHGFPYYMRFLPSPAKRYATRWYRTLVVAKRILALKGISSTWASAVEDHNIWRCMLREFGYDPRPYIAPKSPAPAFTPLEHVHWHCWICPAERYFKKECQVNPAVEIYRQFKSSRLMPLKKHVAEVANLGYIPVCKDHYSADSCATCWEREGTMKVRPDYNCWEMDFDLIDTRDEAAFGMRKEKICESCRMYAVTTALEKKGYQGDLVYGDTERAWEYVQKAEGTAADAAESIIQQTFLAEDEDYNDAMDVMVEDWKARAVRDRRVKAKGYFRRPWEKKQEEWCDSEGFDRFDYAVARDAVYDGYVGRQLEVGCWILPSELWRQNTKFNFASVGPAGVNPHSGYVAVKPVTWPRLAVEQPLPEAMSEYMVQVPESLLPKLDVHFVGRLQDHIKKLLDELDDMVWVSVRGEQSLYVHKVKAMSPRDLLDWMRDPRLHLQGWFKAMGQPPAMEAAIIKLQTMTSGQKRKREVEDTAPPAADPAVGNVNKRRKSDPESQIRAKEADISNHSLIRNGTATGGHGHRAKPPQDAARTASAGAALAGAPAQPELMLKAAVLAMPWPRPRSEFSLDEFRNGCSNKAIREHGFGAERNFGMAVPASASYVSPKVLDFIHHEWYNITGGDDCYCKTCSRRRHEEKRLKEERVAQAKLAAELKRKESAPKSPRWAHAGQPAKTAACGIKIMDRPAKPTHTVVNVRQETKTTLPAMQVPAQMQIDLEMDELSDEYLQDIDPTLDVDGWSYHDEDDEETDTEGERGWEDHQRFGSDEV